MVPASQSLLVSRVPRAALPAAAACADVEPCRAARQRARGRTQMLLRLQLIARVRSRAGRRSRFAFCGCGLPCCCWAALRRLQPFAQPLSIDGVARSRSINRCVAAMRRHGPLWLDDVSKMHAIFLSRAPHDACISPNHLEEMTGLLRALGVVARHTRVSTGSGLLQRTTTTHHTIRRCISSLERSPATPLDR